MIMIMIMIMCLQLLPKGGEGWNSSRMTGLAAWNPPVSITLLLEVIINRQTDRETWYVSWDWAAQSNSTELTKCSGLMQSSRTPLCVILNLHVHTLPVYRSPHTTTVTGRGRVSWQPYMQYSSRFSLNLIGAWAGPRQTKTTSFLCNTWNALNSYYVQRISGHNSTEIHKCPDIYGFVNILLWKIRLEPEPKRRFFCAQPAGKKFYRKLLVPHFPPLLFCSSFFPSRFSILHLHCDKRIFN